MTATFTGTTGWRVAKRSDSGNAAPRTPATSAASGPRSLPARRIVSATVPDFVPLAGWAVQGSVAYGGTRALGRGADEYFARGAPADLTKVRQAAERLRG